MVYRLSTEATSIAQLRTNGRFTLLGYELCSLMKIILKCRTEISVDHYRVCIGCFNNIVR
jgi:hypothetical protein